MEAHGVALIGQTYRQMVGRSADVRLVLSIPGFDSLFRHKARVHSLATRVWAFLRDMVASVRLDMHVVDECSAELLRECGAKHTCFYEKQFQVHAQFIGDSAQDSQLVHLPSHLINFLLKVYASQKQGINRNRKSGVCPFLHKK